MGTFLGNNGLKDAFLSELVFLKVVIVIVQAPGFLGPGSASWSDGLGQFIETGSQVIRMASEVVDSL